MESKKLIFIDIDNTLLDFNACAKEMMIKTSKEFNIVFPDNILEIFLPINNALWRKIEEGTLTLDGLHEIRWNQVFSALGITGDGPAFEKRFKHHLFFSAIKVDGAKELLEYLSKKYVVCAASNGPYEQQEYRLTKSDLLPFIYKVFVSEKANCSKPSKEFFDYCFNNLKGFLVKDAIMIGDSVSADMIGAKEYGMKTCWFDYYKTGEKPESADYTVSSLLDIKNIL